MPPDVRELHSESAESPTEVTLLGVAPSARELRSENAESPMEVTL